VRSGGYEGEGLWLMDFIYIYKIEWWNLLQLLYLGLEEFCRGWWWGQSSPCTV
jgi:hypothetical protein